MASISEVRVVLGLLTEAESRGSGLLRVLGGGAEFRNKGASLSVVILLLALRFN